MKRKQSQIDTLNTNHFSSERIWIKSPVATMWFNHNEQWSEHTIEATQKFLANALKKSKNFVDVVVEPEYDEGDTENLPQTYLVVHGYRPETDDEYKKRLNGELLRILRDRDTFLQRINYYKSSAFTEKVKKLQAALKELDEEPLEDGILV